MKKLLFPLLAVVLLCSCSSKKALTSIRCATFNIRLDTPVDSLNNWNYRKAHVGQFILDKELDVVGMQEVLYNQLEDLKRALPGYCAVGVGRDDGKTKGEYAPLFFRKDRFELLDSNTFWLSQYPDSIGFIGWDGACTRIATWALLKNKQNDQTFMVVNTHFDHVGMEARRKAALLIIERMKELVGNQPAILTGDFNVSDQSEAYATLTTNEYELKDAWKVAPTTQGAAYTFHAFGRLPQEKRAKIDFIFVSSAIKVLKSEVINEPQGGTGYLSDHNPQIADIEF